MSAFSLRDVTYRYDGDFAVSSVSLEVQPGELVALLGPNGSGKTTLLRLIAGLLRPQRGEVFLYGASPARLSRRQVARQLAVLPQTFAMPFAFTAEEVVLLGRTAHINGGLGPRREDLEAAERVMKRMGVHSLAGRFFNDLSGGERQKVLLAMALVQEPKILLLDEPTAHLDLNHQLEVMELVRGLAEQGITAVASMHDLSLAARYCQRLVLLHRGAIVADGPPEMVLTPANIREGFGVEALVSLEAATGKLRIDPLRVVKS